MGSPFSAHPPARLRWGLAVAPFLCGHRPWGAPSNLAPPLVGSQPLPVPLQVWNGNWFGPLLTPQRLRHPSQLSLTLPTPPKQSVYYPLSLANLVSISSVC